MMIYRLFLAVFLSEALRCPNLKTCFFCSRMSVGLALCPAVLVLLGRNWTECAKRPIKVQVLQEFLSKTCFGVGTPQSFTKKYH